MRNELAILGGTPVVKSAPKPVWPRITEEDVRLTTELVARGEISYVGREGTVAEFEDAALEYFGTQFALTTNTGTSALHSAYFGIGLEPGDEVLAPTYTFLATVMPIIAVNAVPVLIDSNEWTGNIDEDALEAHITPRTKAIAVTHLNGFPVNMRKVMEVANRHGLAVVEDCSHAHGAICDGQKIGTFGHAAAFSLQAKKLVGGGEGGFLLTNHREVFERAVLLGHFRDRCYDDVQSEEYRPFAATGYGLNYRIHPVAAALAKNSLARLEETIELRRVNFEHFSHALAGIPGIRPPVIEDHMSRVVYYSYQPLYFPEDLNGLPAEVFVRAVQAEGVPISRPKSPPLHHEPTFQQEDIRIKTYGPHGRNGAQYRRYSTSDLPRSAAYVARALRFPTTYSIDVRSDLDMFAEAIAKVAAAPDRLFDLASKVDDQLAHVRNLVPRRIGGHSY